MSVCNRHFLREFAKGPINVAVFGILFAFSFFGVIEFALWANSWGKTAFECQCDEIPAGKELVVSGNDKVSLPVGGVYEYETILIQKGGVLEFFGDALAWTTLKSKGDFQM